jgi:hypothetical protein
VTAGIKRRLRKQPELEREAADMHVSAGRNRYLEPPAGPHLAYGGSKSGGHFETGNRLLHGYGIPAPDLLHGMGQPQHGGYPQQQQQQFPVSGTRHFYDAGQHLDRGHYQQRMTHWPSLQLQQQQQQQQHVYTAYHHHPHPSFCGQNNEGNVLQNSDSWTLRSAALRQTDNSKATFQQQQQAREDSYLLHCDTKRRLSIENASSIYDQVAIAYNSMHFLGRGDYYVSSYICVEMQR